jgi:hypothetical protein
MQILHPVELILTASFQLRCCWIIYAVHLMLVPFFEHRMGQGCRKSIVVESHQHRIIPGLEKLLWVLK